MAVVGSCDRQVEAMNSSREESHVLFHFPMEINGMKRGEHGEHSKKEKEI